jgi:rRNA maturation endonuclease Nob1
MEYLVLDAGAIIKGNCLDLFGKTKKIVTVAEVFDEIRDSKSRDLLARLPYEIAEMSPSPAAIKAGKVMVAIIIDCGGFNGYYFLLYTVSEFSKKSGDFSTLSKTDLKLIALTYMLSQEVNGFIASPVHSALIFTKFTAVLSSLSLVKKSPMSKRTHLPSLKASPKAVAYQLLLMW